MAERAVLHSDLENLIQTPTNDAFAFSEKERLILELYDRQQELQLEYELLEAQAKAQASRSANVSDDVLEQQLIVAEQEALQARAEYLLRRNICQNVIVTHPVLKATHGGSDRGNVEQRASPLISERDALSMLQGAIATQLLSVANLLTSTESDSSVSNRRNKGLAHTLLRFAEETTTNSIEDIEDSKLRNQIRGLEKEVRSSRRRYKTMKSIIAGMVVGSGVDWAADEFLRELVLDDEEDIG